MTKLRRPRSVPSLERASAQEPAQEGSQEYDHKSNAPDPSLWRWSFSRNAGGDPKESHNSQDERWYRQKRQ
jgi:hypothetical protein